MPHSDSALPSSLVPRPSSLLSSLSIVVPTLNEAQGIVSFLQPLQRLRERSVELILVDGGSGDGTVAAASPLVDGMLQLSTRGRAVQMNAGAAHASGDVLLFLHADTRLPDDGVRLILDGLHETGRRWGRFDIALSGASPMLRVVEWTMNLRSRLTGIATGDQGLFVERRLFDEIGGFPAIALMEDVALSAALKRHGRPLCLAQRVIASSRRWEKNGIWRTIVLMWRLRLAYFLGAGSKRLAEIYYGHGH
ncbi:MAG TPA: TIGR04283 family arsenosugar biosynthesis glycosyltransferase [Burkholderiales bacterium]|nr:TIGR04283 family arsenosugar biosynthesis glycosyltransferase [Burkholderiales bacterium]